MEDRRSLLFNVFDELTNLLTQYGLSTIDCSSGLCEDLFPEVKAAWDKALELYQDDLVEFKGDPELAHLEEFCCGDKIGREKDLCIKQLRMIVALEDYMAKYREDILAPELWEKSPITAKYPDFYSLLDHDLLFDIATAQSIDEDKIRYKSDLLFYHPKLDYHFLKQFLALYQENTTCTKRIALDPRRILPARKFPVQLREAYWYGPKFNLDNVDDPIYGIEFTVHARLPDSPKNILGLKLDRTEFLWSMKNNQKTLQVEEVIPLDNKNPPGRVAVRYIHTIRDVERHTFVHLDGAIRWYLPENYTCRFKDKLSNHPNADGYLKMFRIDGDISNQDWIDLIANFYSGNELIHEYFGQPMT
jgi:hypothetical protein